MQYEIVSIEAVKDKTYDIRYRTKPWFRRSVELTDRFQNRTGILARRVRDDESFHNLLDVIDAYSVDERGIINFEAEKISLPQMSS